MTKNSMSIMKELAAAFRKEKKNFIIAVESGDKIVQDYSVSGSSLLRSVLKTLKKEIE